VFIRVHPWPSLLCLLGLWFFLAGVITLEIKEKEDLPKASIHPELPKGDESPGI
jgi:hypothetical protein